METADECRICFQPGVYDIFQDELCFEEKTLEKTVTKIKIYIVLNNFLFEKLYSQDEYPSLICQDCCDGLCDSYTFMSLVRKSEQDLRSGIRKIPKESLSDNVPSKTVIQEIEGPDITEDQIEKIEEEIQEVDNTEDNEEFECVLEELEDESLTQESAIVVEPPLKKQRSTAFNVCVPDSIVFTEYELEQENDALQDQTVMVLSIKPCIQVRPKNGSYEFNTAWISSNENASLNLIFKCKHCVKAFSNADFLLKHTLSSHICLICLKIAENYKELNKHSKEHSLIVCHFCQKSCGSSSHFRQHLKKQHMLQLPNHVGIVADKFLHHL